MHAAHGNSLRGLVKHLDKMSEEDVLELNIPTAVPLVYELDENLKPIKKYYLLDEAEVQVRNQQVCCFEFVCCCSCLLPLEVLLLFAAAAAASNHKTGKGRQMGLGFRVWGLGVQKRIAAVANQGKAK